MIIKVCGMREPENIREVEMLDVDCLGFIFYDKSPRYVPENHEYIEAISFCKKNKVGIFVNESLDKLLNKGRLYQLNIMQLHGNETPEMCCLLRQNGYSVIKTFSVSSAFDFQQPFTSVDLFQQTERYRNCCDYFLFDTQCTGYGGSGNRFDWSLMDVYQGETPFLLSGGLTPDCAADIKRFNHPQFAGIDLNSGFELHPAMKDSIKLKDFISEIR